MNSMAHKPYLNKAVIKTAFKINIVILNIFQMQGNLSFHGRGMDLVIITATFYKIWGALSSSNVCSFRVLHFEVLQIKHVFLKKKLKQDVKIEHFIL